jgi:hypothetical protein
MVVEANLKRPWRSSAPARARLAGHPLSLSASQNPEQSQPAGAGSFVRAHQLKLVKWRGRMASRRAVYHPLEGVKTRTKA